MKLEIVSKPTILPRELVFINHQREGSTECIGTGTHDRHLSESGRREKRFEQPEDPSKEGGYIDKKFAELKRYQPSQRGKGNLGRKVRRHTRNSG